MVPRDPEPHVTELESPTELRDLLGLRGGIAWLFLAILETTVVLYMVGNLGAESPVRALTALGVMAVAGALVMAAPLDPLAWAVNPVVAGANPAATALTTGFPRSSPTPHIASTTFP